MAATATANLDRLGGARPSFRRRATNVLASVGMVLAFLIASIPLIFINTLARAVVARAELRMRGA